MAGISCSRPLFVGSQRIFDVLHHDLKIERCDLILVATPTSTNGMRKKYSCCIRMRRGTGSTVEVLATIHATPGLHAAKMSTCAAVCFDEAEFERRLFVSGYS